MSAPTEAARLAAWRASDEGNAAEGALDAVCDAAYAARGAVESEEVASLAFFAATEAAWEAYRAAAAAYLAKAPSPVTR